MGGEGQRRGKKGVRETDIGRVRDGGGETYQVSGLLFDGSLECNENSNHEVPQFRPTPFQVTPIWTEKGLQASKLQNHSC